MGNLEVFKEEELKYKDTLVLDAYNVVLFMGMKYDDPNDYYYVFQKFGQPTTYLCSGVAKIIFLKNFISKEDYQYLVEVWNYNNINKAI